VVVIRGLEVQTKESVRIEAQTKDVAVAQNHLFLLYEETYVYERKQLFVRGWGKEMERGHGEFSSQHDETCCD